MDFFLFSTFPTGLCIMSNIAKIFIVMFIEPGNYLVFDSMSES